MVDFGFARLKPKREINEEGGGMRTPCFTLQYAAPEVLEQALPADASKARREDVNGYDESCDLWSLGVVMYVLLSGRSPFLAHRAKDDTAMAIMKRIRSGDLRMDSEKHDLGAWKYVSPAAKQLVRGLLTVDPKKRLTLDDLFNSAWIKVMLSKQFQIQIHTNHEDVSQIIILFVLVYY